MPRDKAHTIGGLPRKPRGVRERSSWERQKAIFDLRASGVSVIDIAKQLGMQRQGVYAYLKKGPPGAEPPAPKTPHSRTPIDPTPPPDLEPSYTPDETTPSGSIDFLKSVQADMRVPITERIKCAIAVARLETAKEASSWTPPSDPTLWAEALADAFRASSPEAQSKARETLTLYRSVTPAPKPASYAPERPVSEEGV